MLIIFAGIVCIAIAYVVMRLMQANKLIKRTQQRIREDDKKEIWHAEYGSADSRRPPTE